jgi:geranylgeranyl diphosphate synthase type I
MMIPDDFKRLIFFNLGIENATVVRRRHDDFTIGQHLDLAFEEQDSVSVDQYMEMIGGKTSSLLSAASEIGAMLANAREDRRQAYAEFGRHLGLAFQVQDDILGIWGEPSITGKPAGDDLLAKKKTLPILYGSQHSAEFRELWQQEELSEVLIEELRTCLEQAGALEYAQEIASQHTKESLASLQHAHPSGPAATELKQLAQRLLTRHS